MERVKGAKGVQRGGARLLGEANTAGQASPRSLAKGFKLLEALRGSKVQKGAK